MVFRLFLNPHFYGSKHQSPLQRGREHSFEKVDSDACEADDPDEY